MSRLPGGALMIALGLLVLWLAITGKLDRFASAWRYVTGGDPAAGTVPAGAVLPPASNSGGIHALSSPAVFNSAAMVNSLSPTVGI